MIPSRDHKHFADENNWCFCQGDEGIIGFRSLGKLTQHDQMQEKGKQLNQLR